MYREHRDARLRSIRTCVSGNEIDPSCDDLPGAGGDPSLDCRRAESARSRLLGGEHAVTSHRQLVNVHDEFDAGHRQSVPRRLGSVFRVMLCPHSGHNITRNDDQPSEIPRVMTQRVDGADQTPDLVTVHADVGEHLAVECCRGVLDGGAPQVGDLHQRGPAVGGVGQSPDQLRLLESTDRVGDAGDVDLESVAGLGDREGACRENASRRSNSKRENVKS